LRVRAARYSGSQCFQDGEIVLEVMLMAPGCEDIELVCRFVDVTFGEKSAAGFAGEMAVMEVLDGLLEADGDGCRGQRCRGG
jgi:hypothetical protein